MARMRMVCKVCGKIGGYDDQGKYTSPLREDCINGRKHTWPEEQLAGIDYANTWIEQAEVIPEMTVCQFCGAFYSTLTQYENCPNPQQSFKHIWIIKSDLFSVKENIKEAFQMLENPDPFNRPHDKEKLQQFAHTTASYKPEFAYIPYSSLVALADRFALGTKKHGSKSWNAFSSQAGLRDEAWIRARVEHVIHHCFMYLMKRNGMMADDGDNDAAAIMWGGSLLHEANEARKEDDKNKCPPSPGDKATTKADR